jgi:hypothetical protein
VALRWWLRILWRFVAQEIINKFVGVICGKSGLGGAFNYGCGVDRFGVDPAW